MFVRAMPCPDCGCEGCELATDPFTGTGGATPSAQWDHVSGDATVGLFSNEMVLFGSSPTPTTGALVENTTAFPSQVGRVTLSMKVQSPTAAGGFSGSILAAYTDVNNCIEIRLEAVDGTDAELNIEDISSGTPEELIDPVTITGGDGDWLTFEVCWTGYFVRIICESEGIDKIWINSKTGGLAVFLSDTPSGGGELYFDNLTIEKIGEQASGCDRCQRGGDVLLWLRPGDSAYLDDDVAGSSGTNNFSKFTQVFTDLGINVDKVDDATDDDWTGDINDYFLVVWPMALAEPAWWGEGVSDGSWVGRLLYTSELDGLVLPDIYGEVIDYVNTLTAITGLSTTGANTGTILALGDCPGRAPETDPLTEDVGALGLEGSSVVGGGTLLLETAGGDDLIRHSTVSDTSYVLAGDMTWFLDAAMCNGLTLPTGVTRFLRNMYLV